MSAAVRFPSASHIGRADHCHASCVIPVAGHPGDESFGRRGHALHRYAEVAHTKGRAAALGVVADEYGAELAAEAALVPSEVLPVKGAQVEVAFELNLSTGAAKEVGRSINRGYPVPDCPSWQRVVNGTADVVVATADGTGYVADYKTGSDVYVPEPAENLQLLTLALMAARAYGWHEVRAELIFLRGEYSWRKGATFDEADLDAHLVALRALATALEQEGAQSQHDVHEGDWCRYCPCYFACPAKTSLASHLGAGDEPTLTLRLDDETVPRVWERLREATRLIEAVKGQVEEYVWDHDVPLPDGRVLGRVTVEKKFMDGAAMHSLLSRRYGHEVADKAVEWTTSETKLKHALGGPLNDAKRDGVKLTQKSLIAMIQSELKGLGGLTVRRDERVEPHKPKVQPREPELEAVADLPQARPDSSANSGTPAPKTAVAEGGQLALALCEAEEAQS